MNANEEALRTSPGGVWGWTAAVLCIDKTSSVNDNIIISEVTKMRITIDIDESDLDKIQKCTGIRKRSPAIRKAIADYIKEMEKKDFIMKVMEGRTDYPLTNEDLEKQGTYDTH